jgi:hypothetical protein
MADALLRFAPQAALARSSLRNPALRLTSWPLRLPLCFTGGAIVARALSGPRRRLRPSLTYTAPGSPDLAVLSYVNSFHGREFGSPSTTRSKAVHKLDIPSFN